MSDVQESVGAEASTEGQSLSEGHGPSASDTAPQSQIQEPQMHEPKSLREKISAIHDAKKAQSVKEPTGVQAAGAGVVSPEVNQPAGVAQAAAEQVMAEAFKPSFKFKFLGEEKDIPELLHSVIKDADSEKLVRELVEKSMGLDYLKPRHEKVFQEHTTLTSGLNKLDGFLERDQAGKPKDLGKFLTAFKLTDNDLFHYAQERLQYHQLPPDQKGAVDAEHQARERAMALEEENATLQQRQVDLDAYQKRVQLEQMMSQPVLQPVIAGYPGGNEGFMRAVAQTAFVYETMNPGSSLTPEQAVALHVQQFGLSAKPNHNASGGAASAMAPAQAPNAMVPAHNVSAQPVQAMQEQAPTLPRVPSQGTSPARKMVSSIKDLKKRRDELSSQM